MQESKLADIGTLKNQLNFQFNNYQRRYYLQWLCNKFGDFFVSQKYLDKNDGQWKWTKHRSVLDCWHKEENFKWLDNARHRQILPCEIVIDLDPPKWETPSSINPKFKKVLKYLRDEQYKYFAYFSGSRGFHIHIMDYTLTTFSKIERIDIRKILFEEVATMFENFVIETDDLKAHDSTMIALEFTPNTKTDRPKIMVDRTIPLFEPIEEMVLR